MSDQHRSTPYSPVRFLESRPENASASAQHRSVVNTLENLNIVTDSNGVSVPANRRSNLCSHPNTVFSNRSEHADILIQSQSVAYTQTIRGSVTD